MIWSANNRKDLVLGKSGKYMVKYGTPTSMYLFISFRMALGDPAMTIPESLKILFLSGILADLFFNSSLSIPSSKIPCHALIMLV